MLSNVDLKPLLMDPEEPLVRYVKTERIGDFPESPLQPSSLDLHIGEIHIPPAQRQDTPDHSRQKYVIPAGGAVVLVTREHMNFPAGYAGLMFPKSAKLAECGILLTNFGRVDPGFRGPVRYAVINMGREAHEVRVGDSISSLVVFRLASPANPDWSSGRAVGADRTVNFVRSLSPEQLALGTVLEQARNEATRVVHNSLLQSTLVAVVIGMLATGLTLGLTWYGLIEPRLDRYEQAFEATQRTPAPAVAPAPPGPGKP